MKKMILILLFTTALPAVAEKPLVLKMNEKGIELSSLFTFYEDKSKTVAIEDLIRNPGKYRFQPGSGSGVQNFGFSRSTYWARIRLQNGETDKALWMMEFTYPHIDKLGLYEVEGGKLVQERHFGRSLPFRNREVQNVKFIASLHFRENTEKTMYLRVESDGPVQFPVMLWRESQLIGEINTTALAHGLFFGIIIVMILYNFFLYVSIRDQAYLYYVLFIFSFFMFQASIDAYTFQFLWPNSPVLAQKSIVFFMSSAQVTELIFTLRYLSLNENHPRKSRFLKILTFIAGISTVLSIFLPYAISIKIGTALTISVVTASMAFGFISAYSGYRPARFFIMAFLMFVLGATVYALKAFGILPSNIITENGPRIGSAIELVVLSLGLADRFNQLRREKEEAQKESLLLKDQLNRQLEDQVAERTADLNRTLEKLTQTQKNLVESEKKSVLNLVSAGIAHELNNPLNYIAGSVPNLKKNLKEVETMLISLMDDDENIEAVRIRQYFRSRFDSADEIMKDMEFGMRKTTQVINEIRGMTEVDGRVLERTDLKALIHLEIQRARMLLLENRSKRKVKIVISRSGDMELETNPYVLGRALRNLLHNAIFYALQSESEPEVRINLESKKEEKLTLVEVANNGPFIGNDQREKIFDMFFTTKKIGEGRGTGLALARSLLENVQGQLYLSEPGDDSHWVKFTLVIPLRIRLEEQGAITGAEPKAG